MPISLLQHEVRILGRGVSLGPVVAIAAIGLAALLMANSGIVSDQMANNLTAMVELTFPLVVGILAASIASSDQVIELQRTVQTRYYFTLLRRIGLLFVWSALLAVGASTILITGGYWVVPESVIVGQLSWAAPMIWFIGAGLLLAAALRNWSAAASLLGGVWILQNVLDSWFVARDWARSFFIFMTTHQPAADDWMSTRLTIAGMGVLFGVVGLVIKSRTETLDVGGDQ